MDISLASEYAAIAGFTREELKKYFHDHLVYAAAVSKHLSQEQVTDADLELLLDEMQEWYGGYCFDRYAKTRVFSTWSVLNFFLSKNAKFKPYWYNSGGSPEILKHSVRELGDFFFRLLRSEPVPVEQYELSGPPDFEHMHPAVLLYQTGYLTISNCPLLNECIDLGFPGRELRNALTRLCHGMLFCKPGVLDFIGDEEIDSRQSAAEVVAYFNKIFTFMDYEHVTVDSEWRLINLLCVFFAVWDNYALSVYDDRFWKPSGLIVNPPGERWYWK